MQIYMSLKPENRETHFGSWTLKVVTLVLYFQGSFCSVGSHRSRKQIQSSEVLYIIYSISEFKHDLYLLQSPAKLKLSLLLALYFPSFPLSKLLFKLFLLLENIIVQLVGRQFSMDVLCFYTS